MQYRYISPRPVSRPILAAILVITALSFAAVGVIAQRVPVVVDSVKKVFGIMEDTPGVLDRTPGLATVTENSACVAGSGESVFVAGTCPRTILPNNLSGTTNARAPSAAYASSRAVYLITASEMAASGYLSGQTPTKIGWNYQSAPGVFGMAPLRSYLQNTTDVSNTKSVSFATAITGMINVHNATTVLPGSAGPFDVAFSGGSSFTYTGGGLYVAFDWGPYAGTLSDTTVIWVTSTLANGLLGNNTGIDTLDVSSFRPETRLESFTQNDAGVAFIYSYGELPRAGRVPGQAIQAVIVNYGAQAQTNVQVTLNVTGADTFTDTQVIPSLSGCGAQAVVTFANFTPSKFGSDTITVSLPADDVAVNNSLSKPLNITPNSYTYKIPGSTRSAGVGISGSTGAFVAKFITTAASSVSDVKLEFTQVGATTYRVVIYGDAGGRPSSTVLYRDAADRTVAVAGPVIISLPSPVAVGPGNFYVGVQQTNTTPMFIGLDYESPLRTGSFFFSSGLSATSWNDEASRSNFSKLNIGVNLQSKSPADFDGDGRSDLSVWRDSDGNWYTIKSADNTFSAVHFGSSGDVLVPGDYDGDGKADLAVFRSGTWYIQGSTAGFSSAPFGLVTDLPAQGDFDGDGKTDVAVFRPSNGTWYVQASTAGFSATQFGVSGDKPVVGDYDGDGKADIAVYRPSDGNWYQLRSTAGFASVHFGISTDKVVPADYDGDGKTDLAVYRDGSPANWFLLQSTAGFVSAAFGTTGDTPVPGDFDGDGKADVSVFRPSNGTWYLQRSASGFLANQFGVSTDKPVEASYVPVQ